MRILSVDPGFGRMGVAILEKEDGGKEVLLHSDCIETSKRDPFPSRLGALDNAARKLIEEWRPDSLALEKLFFSKNVKTAMKVAEVRGMLIALAANMGLVVEEYTPGEVKVAVAGSGNASKAAVADMLKRLLVLKKLPRYDDEYDAIAVGITALASRKHRISTGKTSLR